MVTEPKTPQDCAKLAREMTSDENDPTWENDPPRSLEARQLIVALFRSFTLRQWMLILRLMKTHL